MWLRSEEGKIGFFTEGPSPHMGEIPVCSKKVLGGLSHPPALLLKACEDVSEGAPFFLLLFFFWMKGVGWGAVMHLHQMLRDCVDMMGVTSNAYRHSDTVGEDTSSVDTKSTAIKELGDVRYSPPRPSLPVING